MVLAFTVSKLWRIWFWRHLNLEIWWWYPNFVHSAMRYYFFLSHWCGFVLYRYTCIHKIPLQCIAYVILGVLILGTVGWSIPANRILDGPRGLILWLLLGAFSKLPWWSCMYIIHCISTAQQRTWQTDTKYANLFWKLFLWWSWWWLVRYFAIWRHC